MVRRATPRGRSAAAGDHWVVGRAIGSAQPGSGAVREKSAASMAELTLTKGMDDFPVELLEEAMVGQLDKPVQIDRTCTDMRQGRRRHLECTPTNRGPSAHSVSASDGGGSLESISLDFTPVETKDDLARGTPTSYTDDLQQRLLPRRRRGVAAPGFRLSFRDPSAVTIDWDIRVDDVPACDRCARLSEIVKASFIDPPPRRRTVADLMGGPKRPKTGSVPFP